MYTCWHMCGEMSWFPYFPIWKVACLLANQAKAVPPGLSFHTEQHNECYDTLTKRLQRYEKRLWADLLETFMMADSIAKSDSASSHNDHFYTMHFKPSTQGFSFALSGYFHCIKLVVYHSAIKVLCITVATMGNIMVCFIAWLASWWTRKLSFSFQESSCYFLLSYVCQPLLFVQIASLMRDHSTESFFIHWEEYMQIINEFGICNVIDETWKELLCLCVFKYHIWKAAPNQHTKWWHFRNANINDQTYLHCLLRFAILELMNDLVQFGSSKAVVFFGLLFFTFGTCSVAQQLLICITNGDIGNGICFDSFSPTANLYTCISTGKTHVWNIG